MIPRFAYEIRPRCFRFPRSFSAESESRRDGEFDQTWVKREAIECAVVVPLRGEHGILGVMAHFFRHRVSDDEFDVLETLAAVTSSALGSALRAERQGRLGAASS